MKVIETLRRAIRNLDTATNSLDAITQGISNEADLINRKCEQIIAVLDQHSNLLNQKLEQVITLVERQLDQNSDKLDQIIAGVNHQSALLRHGLEEVLGRKRSADAAVSSTLQAPPEQTTTPTFREAMQQIPLVLADRTYNTSHPDYDARIVRNFPGHIFNYDLACENAAFTAIKQIAQAGEVADPEWEAILRDTLAEAKSVAHADQVFERSRFVEQYLSELAEHYGAHYMPGWVNLDDALFLYWLVRQVKPRTIVQTGVCNGLSAAFMMLGLVKNGDEGTLHVIDLPPVFNPQDPAWTVKNKVYGVVIPEGKTSGWLVPDAYRDRFEVCNGDATDLLPKMVDKVDSIDLFYHDSDHTYNHMMFEFRQAKRKLNKGGLVVGDDISWNASLWDFADEIGVPSYNFKGSVGVAFF